MTEITTYSYVVLRYRHDPVTAEFVNVGIVVHSMPSQFLKAQFLTRYGRVGAMFPHLDRTALRSALANVRSTFRKMAQPGRTRQFFQENLTAEEVAHNALPTDDSALQWGNDGVGLSGDLNETLSHLFERMVSRYDTETHVRRTDQDVWRALRAKLEEKHIAARFQEKVIRSDIDEIDFKLAWKNGRWNCIQPLSFDLADGDGIRDKARKWTGNLLAVAKASEAFTPYFVVAKPSQIHLLKDFESALAILRTSPVVPEIYQEEQAGQLADHFADEIDQHDQATRISQEGA